MDLDNEDEEDGDIWETARTIYTTFQLRAKVKYTPVFNETANED
jgi:hypothetical protein